MLAQNFSFIHRISILVFSLVILNTAQAEWSAGGDFSAYYTDDVGLFAVTRRLSLEEDPTQPIVDEPDQGSDFVYEPNVYINWVTENNLGEFQVSLDGGGYIFNDHSEYSHGFMQFTVGQALTDRTKIKFLYDFIPSLYLGLNLVPEIQEGDAEEHEEVEAGERLNNHILAMHLEHELTDYLTLRALVRYGVRLYDQPFSYRDTQFFTIGPHLVWMITPDIELLVGYHFEQGYTDEDQTVQYQDDIGYINHFTSAELKIRVLPEFFIKATFDYEHNDYTGSYATDIHHNGNENVYQGELEFIYELNESAALIAGWQHGKRKFSYEAHSVKNNNAWIGAEYHF